MRWLAFIVVGSAVSLIAAMLGLFNPFAIALGIGAATIFRFTCRRRVK